MKRFIIVALCLSAMACSPITTYHGFNASEKLRESARNHSLTLKEVEYRFGPASLRDSYDDKEMLYYISYIKEQYGVFSPEIVDRKITVLEFSNGILGDMREYALKDGIAISIDSDKTPSYGKELNIVQQMLSNVGRFNANSSQNRNDGSVLGSPGGI